MTLIINADEVVQVLTMKDCIEAVERAFAEEGSGSAVNHPRQRYRVPRQPELGESAWWTNMIAGAVPSAGVSALRINSGHVRERDVDGRRRMDFLYPSRRSYGFVLLFSLETGEPLAIFQDFALSAIRVGATTGAAVRVLSRANASRIGLFGSGNEAEDNLEAICLVRPVEEVKVFSPNEQHRTSFAERMSAQLDVPITPVAAPEDVIAGTDIVMCATNSSQPVFNGALVERGQLVVTIANSDHVMRRTEVDATTMTRSDLIVLNSRETAVSNQQRELLDLVDGGQVSWDSVTDLSTVLAGHHPGRTSDDEIIYYKSNAGVGIQFAATGALILERCREKGLGREIPTEWFGADVGEWLDKGFNPSP
jgi:alanine dehydrogenase